MPRLIPTSWLFVLLLPSASHAVARHAASYEIFGFIAASKPNYSAYDWNILTTLAWSDDPELVEVAHRHGAHQPPRDPSQNTSHPPVTGVRVVLDGRGANSPSIYGNKTARTVWLSQSLDTATRVGLDGINFDMVRTHTQPMPHSLTGAAQEDPLDASDPLVQEYTALVREAAAAFHAAIPGSQVSVDVPWSPDCIDRRCFDFAGLAQAADVLFVMAYDMQSQVWHNKVHLLLHIYIHSYIFIHSCVYTRKMYTDLGQLCGIGQ